MARSPENRRYVIVGNGIAGTTAADQIRRADPNAQITLLTDEPWPLYNRIALPPFLKQKVSQQKVIIKDVEWHTKQKVDLRRETVVSHVNAEARVVITTSGQEVPYDALLIATGGRPFPLPVPGGNTAGVYNFQSLDDAIAIDERIKASRHAVVVGGSYIAYELAEAFRSRGLAVTWLIRGPWFLRRVLDEAGGMLVDEIAISHGVEIIHGEEVGEVHAHDGSVVGVTTTKGRYIDTDLVGVGIGIARNIELAQASGVAVRGGVITDTFLRTNVPGIFAAGDVAEFFDPHLEVHYTMGTWDNATNHGKVVAVNMMGGERPYVDVPTYATTMFHSRIAAMGATPEITPEIEGESTIDAANQNYRRLFFKGNRLVGAVMIGERKGRQQLIDLIRSATPLSTAERSRLLETPGEA